MSFLPCFVFCVVGFISAISRSSRAIHSAVSLFRLRFSFVLPCRLFHTDFYSYRLAYFCMGSDCLHMLSFLFFTYLSISRCSFVGCILYICILRGRNKMYVAPAYLTSMFAGFTRHVSAGLLYAFSCMRRCISARVIRE